MKSFTTICILGIGLTLALIGCRAGDKSAPAEAEHAGSHSHDGWWCGEHGVPEEICALCNAKLAAEFQKEGDWCVKHDRPDSQCFVCHPDYEAKFAAQYEAKYGKKPPEPSDDGHEQDEKKS